MSINIKVRYRALMTHGLSFDIETRNKDTSLPTRTFTEISFRPLVSLKTLLRVRPSLLASSLQSLDAHYQ